MSRLASISASVFLVCFSQVVPYLSSDVFVVSPLDVSKLPQSCFPVPLCDVLYVKYFPDVSFMIMSWSLSVWPHAHLHIFISVTSRFSTWSVSKPCLPLYSLYWRLAPTQCRQWTICSTSALDGIDSNQPSAESLCFLGDLAVVSIHPIGVVASTPSQGSTSLDADP